MPLGLPIGGTDKSKNGETNMTTRQQGWPCEPCGKHAYASEQSAIRWALIRSKHAGRPLRVYRCPEGNGYHLTKQVRRSAA